MDRSPAFVFAVGFALLAGALHALQSTLPIIAVNGGVTTSNLSIVLTVGASLNALVSPVAITLVGYAWGRSADVPREYVTFAGTVFGAATLGYAVTFVGSFVGAGVTFFDEAGRVVFALLPLVGQVTVALEGLAGAAVGWFRSR